MVWVTHSVEHKTSIICEEGLVYNCDETYRSEYIHLHITL
jgi:hypothetical protein